MGPLVGLVGTCLVVLCVFVLVFLCSAPGYAADAEAVLTACPGVSAWQASHPEETEAARAARDAARSVTLPQLKAMLVQRADIDQRFRKELLRAPSNAVARDRVGNIDASNLEWLRILVRDVGFPTARQVGEDGVGLAWLLVQHADSDPGFQAKLLPVLEQRHADGELSGDDLARFTDRVLRSQGKPQRYGTQFDWSSGHFTLPDPAQTAVYDIQRQALGVMPLADYACRMTEVASGFRHPAQP